jgi:NADH-quinone oxidoreductase subunit H
MPVLSILLAGWASNNKYSLLGAMRNIAQILAYELPIAFTILSITVLASSMNLTQITLAQSSKHGTFGWFFVPCFLGLVIMFICTLAELNRCPFDLPEAESELVCGYNTEYSGMRFALLYLSEYGMLLANALLITVLFFGGYLSPFGEYLTTGFWIYIEQVSWLIIKTFIVIFLIVWIRATLPRMSSPNLLKLSWSVLLPASIINLFFVVIIKYVGGV